RHSLAQYSLRSGNIADYKWGSYVTQFHLAPFGKRTWAEILASIMAGAGIWKTPAELRAYIAFLHEIVHYFQDVTTGVGHWDFVAREHHRAELLGLSRFVRNLNRKEYRAIGKTIETAERQLENDLIFLPFDRMSPERRKRFAKDLKTSNHG